MPPPGRAVAALGSALRAFVVNVLGVAAATAVSWGVFAAVATGDAVAGMFGFWLGVFYGGIAGAGAGGIHAVSQAALMLALPAHRRRPASPALATVVSACLAGIAYAWLSTDDPSGAERAVAGIAAAVYVAATWPVANAVVPPGRPRRRRRGRSG